MGEWFVWGHLSPHLLPLLCCHYKDFISQNHSLGLCNCVCVPIWTVYYVPVYLDWVLLCMSVWTVCNCVCVCVPVCLTVYLCVCIHLNCVYLCVCLSGLYVLVCVPIRAVYNCVCVCLSGLCVLVCVCI